MAPKKWWLEDYCPFGFRPIFRGYLKFPRSRRAFSKILSLFGGVTLGFWTLDILACFCVGYYARDGTLVVSLRKIARQYLTCGYFRCVFFGRWNWPTIWFFGGCGYIHGNPLLWNLSFTIFEWTGPRKVSHTTWESPFPDAQRMVYLSTFGVNLWQM